MSDLKEIIFKTNEHSDEFKREKRKRRTRKAHDSLQNPSYSESQSEPKSESQPPKSIIKKETVVVEKTTKQKPIVVLSPPRKKVARILLVSGKKDKTEKNGISDLRKALDHRKTFRAKKITVTIDNTAKTAKKKYLLMKQVEELSGSQLQEAAIAAKLSRRESVAKVPEKLLRQMLKDCQSIRGAYI